MGQTPSCDNDEIIAEIESKYEVLGSSQVELFGMITEWRLVEPPFSVFQVKKISFKNEKNYQNLVNSIQARLEIDEPSLLPLLDFKKS